MYCQEQGFCALTCDAVVPHAIDQYSDDSWIAFGNHYAYICGLSEQQMRKLVEDFSKQRAQKIKDARGLY